MDLTFFAKKDMVLTVAEEACRDEQSPLHYKIISHLSRLTLSPASSKEVELIPENRVNISDLFQSTSQVLNGKYFLCRTIAPSFQKRAVHVAVDDPEGILATSVCFYKFNEGKDAILPVGTILAIKNPFFENESLVGYAVWVKNQSELVIIEDSKDMGVEWRASIPARYAKYLNRPGGEDSKAACKTGLVGVPKESETPEAWKILGNKYFEEKKLDLALESYGCGLALSPNHTDLLSNRCLVNLKMGNYTEALNDADAVLKTQPNHSEAIYRKACSIIGLRRYQEALEFLQSLTPEQTQEKSINLKTTLDQQLRGIYDMNYFLDNKDIETESYSTCAEYCVEFEWLKTAKKFRGVAKSKADIKAGQLIIVSKAFVFDDNLVDDVPDSYKSSTEYGCNYRNIRIMANEAALKLRMQPDLCKEFYSMYAGPKLGYLKAASKGWTNLDTQRIECICFFNYFEGSARLGNFDHPTESNVTSGIWVKPSFLRHSCVNYNSNWILLKDFMFVRTTKDIKKGEEITMPYVPTFVPYEKRVERLQDGNHKCECELCQLEEKEPESIHNLRKDILVEVKIIPENVALSPRQLHTLKTYARQLDNLRPNSLLNFSLFEVQHRLACNLMRIDKSEAKAIYKLIFEKTAHCVRIDSVVAAGFYLMACLISDDISGAKEFLPIWQRHLELVCGIGIEKAINMPGPREVQQMLKITEVIP